MGLRWRIDRGAGRADLDIGRLLVFEASQDLRDAIRKLAAVRAVEAGEGGLHI